MKPKSGMYSLISRLTGLPSAIPIAPNAARERTWSPSRRPNRRTGASDRGDAPLERARALADLSSMLRRLNRRTESRELLREALDTLIARTPGTLADYAETELRATVRARVAS